jgi:ABC-type sugar transport system substrate-binding protein
MRSLFVVLAALASTAIFASSLAADENPVIAVFTKNTTNPAYENFRLGADKAAAAMGARTRHYVPNKPDNVDEQKALVEQALLDRPDLILFVPVDDVAMAGSLNKITEAGIPVVTAVIAANDAMALGALDVMRDAGRTATVVGANGILEAVKQIDAGALLASVDFNTFKMACIGVEAALRSRAGESVPQKIMLAADLIDRSNYKSWLVPTRTRMPEMG